jgi:hypothetical protein
VLLVCKPSSFTLTDHARLFATQPFFQGGHSDHQNRLAEAVVCIFRLAPGLYPTHSTFESLFPSPEDDPAYSIMLRFAGSPLFGPEWGRFVNRFH